MYRTSTTRLWRVASRRNLSASSVVICLGFVVALALVSSAMGQSATIADGPYAPGVLTVIPSEPVAGETYSGPRELADIVQGFTDLDWTPHFTPNSQTLLEMAKNVTYRRSVWNLEFSFKPVRMMMLDLPQEDDTSQQELIWYLVYRVRNMGYHLNPKSEKDDFGNETFGTNRVNHTIRFFPQFVLTNHETGKSVLDRVIPSALGPIQKKERTPGELHHSVSISGVDIPLSSDRTDRGLWGVATWRGIDPRTDFFSIFVSGLTNAYRFEENFAPNQPPGEGRTFQLKTLQLNFWRSGDALDLREQEIRPGLPGISSPLPEETLLDMYGLKKRVDYQWIYR